MKKNAVIILADGFEEVEAIAPIDLLRRADISVTIAGLGATQITGAHGITVSCDTTVSEIHLRPYDAVILPGGMPGTTNLLNEDQVMEMVHRTYRDNYLVAAICAAPQILDRVGALTGKKFTCFPGVESKISHGEFSNQPVVRSGNVITSRSAGSSIDFALAIIEYLSGAAIAEDIKNRIVY